MEAEQWDLDGSGFGGAATEEQESATDADCWRP